MMPERSEWLPGTFVTMPCPALVGWWRRCSQDVKAGIRTVETWDDFKREFKRQFYPENSQEFEEAPHVEANRYSFRVHQDLQLLDARDRGNVGCMPAIVLHGRLATMGRTGA